jgi:hypothetical protein
LPRIQKARRERVNARLKKEKFKKIASRVSVLPIIQKARRARVKATLMSRGFASAPNCSATHFALAQYLIHMGRRIHAYEEEDTCI